MGKTIVMQKITLVFVMYSTFGDNEIEKRT